MVTHSGNSACASCDLMCDRCTAQVHVHEGREIPRCPNCGNNTFSQVEAAPPEEVAAE